MFDSFKKMKFSEQVASLIQKKIINDEILVGSKLPPERELAKELGVSRTVVREALQILNLLGYVNIKRGPKGGIFVCNVYHKPFTVFLENMAKNGKITIDDIWEIRTYLEPLLIEKAIKRASDEDLKRLDKVFLDVDKHLDDPVYLKNKNFEFHIVLADICGNPVLAFLIKAVLETLAEIAFNFLNLEFEQKLLLIHKDLKEAIFKRDIERAKELFSKDLSFLRENLKKTLNKLDLGN